MDHSHVHMLFSSCDLDPDPITLICKFHLDILEVYLHTKKTKFLGQGFQKLEHKQDRQTDRHTDVTKCITSRTRRQ